MSETEIQEITDEIMDKPTEKKRIARSTGKVDRRSITSKINLKKGGQMKLEKLKHQKEHPEEYQIIDNSIDDDSSSSDDDNVLVLKQKSKKKPIKSIKPIQGGNDMSTILNEMNQMKDIISNLTTKKKKSKKKVIVKQVQTPIPTQLPIQQTPNQQMSNHIKKQLLSF